MQSIGVVGRKAPIEPDIATLNPAQLREPIALKNTIGWVTTHQYPDPPHPPVLLRPSRQRPYRRSESRNELPPSHSITSSAMASSLEGISRLRALAVLRLRISCNLVG